MAHFAQLDSNNIVINVIVVNNTELGNPTGLEKEQDGIQFCKEHFGENTVWKQTSYNRNFRGNFAGIGFTYDSGLDKFLPPGHSSADSGADIFNLSKSVLWHVVTETVFAIPGIGRLVVDAILRRDYPVIQGVILLISLAYVLINLIVDLIYSLIDPRVRY